jgi:acyl-CoA thioesterase-1
MLRANGYNVSAIVNAVFGDTSAGILSRADASAEGARAVVFDTGGPNDRRKGLSPAATQANLAQIAAHIRAHGAAAIPNNSADVPRQADGIHFTAGGHTMVAARALPKVIAAIGKRS